MRLRTFLKKALSIILIIYDNENSPIHIATTNNNCTFNPLDKLIEAYEENKKLYERLLEAVKKNS